MFDHVVWELSIMFRRADFALFSGNNLIGGLSVYPDMLPGEQEPRDWAQRFETVKVGPHHRHAIAPGQLRSVLPPLSRISWGQMATADIFRSRIWLHGRGENLIFSYSKANPSHPQEPDQETLGRIEGDLRQLQRAAHAP